MRIALCLSGQMRTYKKCYPSLKEFILEPLKPDIFIHTWSDSGITTKIKKGAEFKTEEVTREELNKLYSPKSMIIENFKKEYTEKLKGVEVPEILKEKEPRNYKGTLPMFYKMQVCNELKSKWEKEKGFTYDLVIRLRPDLEFLEEIPKKVLNQPEKVWHNNSEDGNPSAFWQISDKFFLSNSRNMDSCCSVFENLKEYWKNPLGEGRKRGQHRVGERLMAYHLKRNKELKLREFFSKCYILRQEEYSKLKEKRTLKEYLRAKAKRLMKRTKIGNKLIDYYYSKIVGGYK